MTQLDRQAQLGIVVGLIMVAHGCGDDSSLLLSASSNTHAAGSGAGGFGGIGTSAGSMGIGGGGIGGTGTAGSGIGGTGTAGSGIGGTDASGGGPTCLLDGQQCSSNGQCCSQMCLSGTCWAPPSCAGLPANCGPGRNESCCASAVVTGGTYNRINDPLYPATVSDFRLDRFEITVGRFRAFVATYPGNKPISGAGAHPRIGGSGWDPAWDANLPADQAALMAAVKCSLLYPTWTDVAGANENLPMNCIRWYEAFAFCAWDRGRLPTESEWNYAAAGGAEQREYPWSNPPSSTMIDASYAVYECTGDGSLPASCVFGDILQVGSKSLKGDSRWGQADLAGSIWEWNLDWWGPFPYVCDNCANLQDNSARATRGGDWYSDAGSALSSTRGGVGPTLRYFMVGARCARTP